MIQHDIKWPCLRKVEPRIIPVLRQHPYFRYLLRGVPSGPHETEADLVLAMRIYGGVELDADQKSIHRLDGAPWKFLFVRAEEKAEMQPPELEGLVIPEDPVNAPYLAPEITEILPVEEFILDSTRSEDKDSILEDLAVVFVKVERSDFRILDWWIEFG